MTNTIVKSVIALFAIFYIIGCNEAETIIESDPSKTQVLIIEEYNSAKIADAMNIETENNNYYSKMYVSDRYHFNFSDAINREDGTVIAVSIDSLSFLRNFYASLVVTNESTLTKTDSLVLLTDYHLADSMLNPIRLGTVKIGDVVLEEFENANVRGYSGTHSDRLLNPGWEYKISNYNYNFTEIFSSSALSGPTQFTITNSPTIQDVNTTINLPVHNEITNIHQHQVIDTLNDLTIELKEPIGGSESYRGGFLIFYAHYMTINIYNNNRVQMSDSWIDGITIFPIESSSTITIPSDELIKFKNEHKDAKMFSIYLSPGCAETTEILLYNISDGSLFDGIRPLVSSSFEIFIKFKE